MQAFKAAAIAGLIAMAGVTAFTGSARAEPVKATAAAAADTSVTYYLTIVRQFSDDGLAVDRGHTFNGEPLVSWPPRVDQHNTQWSMENVGPAPAPGFTGVFTLRARHSNQCIDVAGNPVEGARLVQQPCDAARLTQQWYYGPASDSGSELYRHIYSRAAGLPGSATAKVMKVKDGGSAGSPIVLSAKDGFGSTRFHISAPFRVTETTEIIG